MMAVMIVRKPRIVKKKRIILTSLKVRTKITEVIETVIAVNEVLEIVVLIILIIVIMIPQQQQQQQLLLLY